MDSLGILPPAAKNRMGKISRLNTLVVTGDRRARSELTRHGVVWQSVRAISPDGQNIIGFDYKTSRNKFAGFLEERLRLIDTMKLGIVLVLTIHLGVNAEHIWPLPLILAVYKVAENLLVIESRDLGKGMGNYLQFVDQYHTSRSDNLEAITAGRQLPDGGAGLFLFNHQVLSGCQGSVSFESGGEKVVLTRARSERREIGEIRSSGSPLVGTRIRAFLRLDQEWGRTPSGWNENNHFYLPSELKTTKWMPEAIKRTRLERLCAGLPEESWTGFFVNPQETLLFFKPDAEALILASNIPSRKKDQLIEMLHLAIGDVWRE